jgi:hypothetical protein
VTDGLALGRYQTMARCVGDQRVLIARLTTRYSRAFALHEMMRERNRIRTAPRSAHARNRIRTSPQAHTDNEREREKRKKKYEWSSGDGPDTPLSFSLFRAFAFAAVLATRTGTGARYIPRRDIAPPDAFVFSLFTSLFPCLRGGNRIVYRTLPNGNLDFLWISIKSVVH